MARLRIPDAVGDDTVTMMHDSSVVQDDSRQSEDNNAVHLTLSVNDDESQISSTQNTLEQSESTTNQKLNVPRVLVCKKTSPRKDARKQVHLKPIGSINQDVDLTQLTVTKDRDAELRQRPRRALYSPSKAIAARFPSSTSFESMISDNDDASDFSLPTSLNSDVSSFEIGAKIPDNLVSQTRRQLFSPSKPKAVSIGELDDMTTGFATTKLDESEQSIEQVKLIQPKLQMHMPSLRPATWSSDDDDNVLTIRRPSTPPPISPTKSKLMSPSKIKCRIPTPPPRGSPNAFWSIEKVNDWNDQHSPQKIVRSPKKSRAQHGDDSAWPSASPRKQSSPCKSRAAIAERKDFDARKKDIATAFLAELDETISEGKIAQLAASTGGVQLIWSKTLNSTAGRANWRREQAKSRSSGEINPEKTKNFASIELAEKVIDDETRLLNVLAHEFCHLANFMVSGIKDRPHGVEFKSWGRKCTLAFGDRGVEVTTKHTYAIDYKYIWACTNDNCQAEFKRHSKSIDPARHTCGVCHAKITQIKPVPRKAADGGKPVGYAGFVKEHYAAIKADMPGANQREVMVKLGEKYRAAKLELLQASDQESVPQDVTQVTEDLETITLEILED